MVPIIVVSINTFRIHVSLAYLIVLKYEIYCVLYILKKFAWEKLIYT